MDKRLTDWTPFVRDFSAFLRSFQLVELPTLIRTGRVSCGFIDGELGQMTVRDLTLPMDAEYDPVRRGIVHNLVLRHVAISRWH
jgi:hypothetical protein